MPAFPLLINEAIVRVDDKTRLDATKSFKTQEIASIDIIEIRPEAAGTFITLDNTKPATWYLDWIYTTAATETITVQITTPGPVVISKDFPITILDAASDKTITSDADLLSEEPDVMKYVKNGRASHIDLHRTITERILTELYKNRILAQDGSKLTINEILDYSEVKEWALYWFFETLFGYVSNVPGDIFETMSKDYEKKKNEFKNLAMNILKLDYDKSGTLDANEQLDYRSSQMVRR